MTYVNISCFVSLRLHFFVPLHDIQSQFCDKSLESFQLLNKACKRTLFVKNNTTSVFELLCKATLDKVCALRFDGKFFHSNILLNKTEM